MNKLLVLLLAMPILVLFFYVDYQQHKGVNQITSQQLQMTTRARSIAQYGFYNE